MEDKETIKKICEECEKKTKIVYRYRDGFFKPRLRGINYLELGRSNIINNPITIFIEYLYILYKKIRNALERLRKWLFPRRQKIFGNVKDSSIVGSITFTKKDDTHVPLHNMHCEFWARTRWLSWRKLGEAITGKDGTFDVPFDLRASRKFSNGSLRFEIYQTKHIYYKDGKPHRSYQLFKSIPVPKSDMIGMRYNLHSIQLFYWEYRDETPVPRVVIKELEKDAPEVYAQGRLDAFYQQVIPVELTKLKHMAQIKFAPETITLESLQNDYPKNLTRCIEKKAPGFTRSDEWMGTRMMNGMNRGYFEKDIHSNRHFWIKYFGVCHYSHNEVYALPTSRVKFELNEDGFVKPVEIILIGPTNAFNKDPWQERVFKYNDGTEWEYAKRVVRVNGAFSTELDEHFTGTHLNSEQFAIAAYRNLRLNPIATLLLPHLKEVSLVNHSADTILLKQFIPHATALTFDGLQHRTRDLLGLQDWKNWKPMKPISPMHSCAHAENLFWNILNQFVNEFVDENIDAIKKEWFEIYRFSEDLVNHSVPVFLSDIDLNSLPTNERELAEERFKYHIGQYGFDPKAKRETRNGELKSISPITLTPDFSKEEEIHALKDACCYMIMMATYMHTWINEHQYDQLGEIFYSGGGLRFGPQARGILAPETDHSISPDPTIATQSLWLANILSRTEYGFITTNYENDVNPRLIELLLNSESEFANWKVNIRAIESRTNI